MLIYIGISIIDKHILLLLCSLILGMIGYSIGSLYVYI